MTEPGLEWEAPPARIIARLDIKSTNVIKGVHLEGLRKVGLPYDLAVKYYSAGADEILFMDAVASLYGRNNILPVVEEVAQDLFVPLTVGGGIRKLEDINDVLRSGADKVAINTAAVSRPEFLREAAETFGSQCIVLSVEAKRDAQLGWQVMTDYGREKMRRSVIEWVEEAEQLGVGEVLVTSIDQEGTGNGVDMDLVKAVCGAVSVPVVVSGGIGSADQAIALFDETDADAVCVASVLHYDTTPIPQLKSALAGAGVRIRCA